MIKNNFEVIEINEDNEILKLTSKTGEIKVKPKINFNYMLSKILERYYIYILIVASILFIFIFFKVANYFDNIKNEKMFQEGNNFEQPYYNDFNDFQFVPPTIPDNYYKDKQDYSKLDKYDKKGENIYSTTGTISFNNIEEMHFGKKEKKNISKLNHIHIAMSFNDDYHLLSSVTIANLLKTAKPSTYIHLHIIAIDQFNFSIMKKLNSLKSKINNNTEFIFHNGDIAKKDFGEHIKNESKGTAEFSRLLAPYFANETDRILVLDSGDLLIKKDLSELYNYPLRDKIIRGVRDAFTECFPEFPLFHKKNYFNGGVLLFNAKKWRELNLYQDIVKFYKGFKFKGRLPTPIQDILNTFFPAAVLGLLPEKYNFQGFYDPNDDYDFGSNIYFSECSNYYGKSKLLKNIEKNLVIRHFNKFKVDQGEANEKITKEWQYYANLTGFFYEICEKYPLGCQYFY